MNRTPHPLLSHIPFLYSPLLVGAVIALAATSTGRADTIAHWTFETNTPADQSNSTTSPTFTADVYTGVGSATGSGIHVSAGTDWTTPAGNGSANSWSSNGWAIGDYYQFTLATANFENIAVSWDQTRSSTGPALFDFEYSLDGTNFTVFTNDYTVGTASWSSSTPSKTSSFTADLNTIATLNNAASVTFRLTAAAAGTAAAGASRIDNFLVTGSLMTSVGDPIFWDPNGTAGGMGGSGNWNSNSWATAETGTAAVQAFDSSKRVVFSGLGGSIRIDTADVVANNGLQFDSDQYVISSANNHTLTLGGTGPRINVVSAGHRATVTAKLSGSRGFTKVGSGILHLDADNTYTGNTTINAGTVEITRDRSLGATNAGIVLNGGTLKPVGNITLHSERTITGSGTLDIAAGNTVTVAGAINAGTLTLTGGGSLQLNNSATLSGLTFNAPSTLHGGTSLIINGNITVAHTTGTSTINDPVSLGSFTTSSGNRVVTVNAGATLKIPGPITLTAPATSSNGRLHKLGAGTLDLGENNGLFGIRLGSATTTSSGNTIPPTDGGTLRITNKQSLGTNQFQFNAGTLHIAQTLTGINAIANSVTIGASHDVPAVITGADVEFSGEIQLFKPTVSIEHTLIVNANVLFSGPLNESTGQTGFSTGLTIGGTGSLVLGAEANTISEQITLDGPTLTLNGALSGSAGVHVKKGTLKGSGFIPFGALTLGDGDGSDVQFSPGDGVTSFVVGSLTLDSDASLKLEIDSLKKLADKLIVGDDIILGKGIAKLEIVDLASAPLPLGFEFTLIQNDGLGPIDGYFAGMPNLHRFSVGRNQFEIDYGSGLEASDLVLRVVPEPGTGALLLVGIALIAGTRRRLPRNAVHTS